MNNKDRTILPFAPKRKKNKGNIIAALDIGSSKICCFIARVDEDRSMRVLGIGHQISQGVRAGNIVDLEAVQNAINATLDHAEEMSNEEISKVIVNFSGGKILTSHADVKINLNGREASDGDVERAQSIGQNETQDADSEFIHLITADYLIDGQSGIRDPRGMLGDVMTAKMHMIMAQYAPIRTLRTALNRCHLQVDDIVVSPYASGLASLVDDEMDLGATVIDMGGGTTTFGFFAEGHLIHADSIPIGGSRS